jgi:palmitoyltransferase
MQIARKTQLKLKDVINATFEFIEQENHEALVKHLKENQDVPLAEIIDERGYTLLHEACFQNYELCATFLVKHAATILTSQALADWINLKTTADGFTGLHFASFKGNTNVCDILLKYGADMQLKNNYGINVMHVAAQGDQPISLYYFKQRGVDIRSRDNRGSTPMHWACYSKSEVALLYLLAWVRPE